MRMKIARAAILLTLGVALAAPAGAQSPRSGEEFNGSPSRSARARTTGRIIVKWRKESARTMSSSARLQKAAGVSGIELKRAAESGEDREILEAVGATNALDVERAAANLERDPSVEYASVEYWRKAHKLTSDALLPEQWYLLSA
jgi:hypothetical protein